MLTEKVRFTSLVPAQLATLLDDATAVAALRDFSRVLVGGQATPVALRERAADLGIAVTRTYGSSETSGGCVYDGVADRHHHRACRRRRGVAWRTRRSPRATSATRS